VEPVSVQIAVLAIADAVAAEVASAKAVNDRAVSAGHRVVARAVVKDLVAPVRDQLARWIADPEIDVVIVCAEVESAAASEAVKPLVSEPIPGFTDLFRWLAFQEIGAAAMTSNAEAARCGSTFVFVLPASAAAVRAAMDKLILPQLDTRGAPRNLVTQMPRLRTEPGVTGGDAIPAAIAAERTASGAGFAPRRPAPITGRRDRPRTGANVIARPLPRAETDDAPTKEIELARLERQIALASESHDGPTEQIELIDPTVPELASAVAEELDDDEPAAPPPAAARPARRPSTQPPPAPPPAAARPARRPSTQPPPAPPSRVARPPTEPPPPPPPRPPSAPPASDELPQGKFVYPVARPRGSRLLVGLALVLAAGLGFAAVVFGLPRFFTGEASRPVADPSAVLDAPPASPPAPPLESAAAAEDQVELLAAGSGEAAPDAAAIAPPPDRAVRPVRPPRPAVPATDTRPPDTRAPSDAAATVTTAPPPPVDPSPPATDPVCDETACVLERYARACCARYRPADTFKPRTGVPAELDRTMVRAGVDLVRPRVISCGERGGARGIVKLAVAVAADGRVTEVTVRETPDAALGTCVAEAMKNASFAKTANGGSFVYPFSF
jgi:molybdopterin adenylyltransferase